MDGAMIDEEGSWMSVHGDALLGTVSERRWWSTRIARGTIGSPVNFEPYMGRPHRWPDADG